MIDRSGDIVNTHFVRRNNVKMNENERDCGIRIEARISDYVS